MSEEPASKTQIELDVADRAMMACCIELSKVGVAAGELPFGSVIALRGQIIAEATNEIMRRADESRHAEIIVIARARQLLGDDELSNCTLYTDGRHRPSCIRPTLSQTWGNISMEYSRSRSASAAFRSRAAIDAWHPGRRCL